MKQILCLSHTPWQAQPNRTQQLLTRLSDAQVLFFEPPVPRGTPMPEQGRRMRSNITVYTLPHSIFPGREVSFLKKVMNKHHFRRPLLWCTCPDQAAFPDQLPCSGVIYDCDREWEDEYLDQESDLCVRADVIFAASEGLAQRLSPCSDNIALLPNGVNTLLFERDDLTPPPALASLGDGPVLCRVGELNRHVELAPLLTAVRARPDWTFVLAGRVTRQVMERLEKYPNVILLGAVQSVEIPDCLSACDLLFDLKRTDRLGCDIVPSHIYEYLCTGKPIVMMMEPDQVEPFPDVVYTAYDSSGFLRRCSKALEEAVGPTAQRRKEYARNASWSLRAAEVSRILDGTGLF